MSKNLTALSNRKGLSDNLFERLVETKGDPSKIKQLANQFRMGEANLFATASSYDFIMGENANKKAYVCDGSSCLCAGTQAKVKQGLLKEFKENEIGTMSCLGRCHENSAFQIDGINYSGEDGLRIEQIAKQSVDSSENYQVYSLLQAPILTETIADVSAYYDLFANQVNQQPKNESLKHIVQSGLRGRGGAGFPTGLKWQSCSEQTSTEKYIVCNADEGDPGAFSDRYLLENRPHSVLFGMLIAGYLVGAQWGVIYIRDEYPESITAINQAIDEFNALDLLTEDFHFEFKVIRGAGAYICGEETALLRSIEGQKPMVSTRPPFPTVNGLFEQPTVLNNVETFAAIHWILDNPAEDFAAISDGGKSTGSKLLSLDSCFCKPGIYEVPMGEKLSNVIEAAGGFSRPTKALHIGGPLGGLVPISHLERLTISFESFAQEGFLLGHASVIGIPESFSMPRYIQHLFDFTAQESCGKCFPCRLGATRGEEMFASALNGEHSINRSLLHDLLETMQQGSLCALGGGVPLPVQNALKYFPDEFSSLFEGEKGDIAIEMTEAD